MQGIPKTPKIPNGFFSVKVGVFYREVFGIKNLDLNVGVLDPTKVYPKIRDF